MTNSIWVAGTFVVIGAGHRRDFGVLAHSNASPVAGRGETAGGPPAPSTAESNDTAPLRMIPRPNPGPAPSPPPLRRPRRRPGRPAPPRPRPAPPLSAIVIGSTQQALINQDRAANGLGPLTWNGCLLNVARSNASRMAAQGAISHTNGPNVDLTCGLGHQAGENVGYWSAGINDAQLNTMFMNSAGHRANILGPYRYVATAWVVAPNGYAYIAVEFS